MQRDGAPSRRRPTVGVTGPDRGGLAAWWMARLALRRAGARAVHVTPSHPVDPKRLDALVLGGGADIAVDPRPDPAGVVPPRRGRLARHLWSALLAPLLFVARLLLSRFAQPNDPEDGRRDRLELRLLVYASRHDLPVLGICRGAQLMNLAEGGSLLWNVRTFYTERPHLHTVLPRRDVRIDEDSRLAHALGAHCVRVNSLHAHAVDRAGKRLRIVAREPSGVTQAIEHTQRDFWVGVQWHPEYLPQLPVQQRLFRALVEHAGSRRRRPTRVRPRTQRRTGRSQRPAASDAGPTPGVERQTP